MIDFATPDLCDAHEQIVRVALPGFRSFGGQDKFYGPLRTIKCHEDNSLVAAMVGEPGQGAVLVVDGVRWPLPDGTGGFIGPAVMMVRPEAIRLVEPSRGVTDATVGARRFLGATALFVVETDHGTVLEVTADPHAVRTGDRVGLSLTGIGVHVFPAASA